MTIRRVAAGMAIVVTAVLGVLTPAGASTGLAGSGAGINLAQSPPEIQACFGSSGFLTYSSNGTEHVNGTGESRFHWSATMTVVVQLTDASEAVLISSATTTVSFDTWIDVDPVTGEGEYDIPVTVDLVRADGTTVHAHLAFANVVLQFGNNNSYAVGLMQVRNFSDYTC